MAKVKNKRNADLADRVQKKKKVDASKKKLNPFEVHINREKIKVLGKKSKHDRGLPGVSRAKAIQKRKETLGTEMKLMNKTNAFIDRRIGEKNTQLSAEDRMIARFAAERAKQHNRKSIYNLADDEILTHRGQTLEQIEKFDDPRSSDEDEEKKFGGLDDDFVSEGHFGGGILSKSDTKDGAKSHKDLIEQLIAESKKRKAEKQKEKEQTLDLTEKLDSEWKDLQPVVFKRQKVEEESLIDKLLSKEEKALDYDRMMRELRFEKRGTPSDGLKSKEQLEAEEKKKIDELEKQRLERMYADDEKASKRMAQSTSKHRSADDLDDNFELDNEQDFMLAYDKDGKPLVPEHVLKDYSVPNARKKFEDGISDTSEEDSGEESDDENEEDDEEEDKEKDMGDNTKSDESSDSSNSKNNKKSQKMLIKVGRIGLNSNADNTVQKINQNGQVKLKDVHQDNNGKKFGSLKKDISSDLDANNIEVDAETSESDDTEEEDRFNKKTTTKTDFKHSEVNEENSNENLLNKKVIKQSKKNDSETNTDKITNNDRTSNKTVKSSHLRKRQSDDSSSTNSESDLDSKESSDNKNEADKSEGKKVDSPKIKKVKLNEEQDSEEYIDSRQGGSESDSDSKIDCKIDELLNKNDVHMQMKQNKQMNKDSESSDSDSELKDNGDVELEENVGSLFDITADEEFNLNELLSGKSPTQQSSIVSELIKKFDPSLAPKNKDMLSKIYAHLLQYINDIFSNLNDEGEIIKSFLIFDKLVPYFYDLAHTNKVSSKKFIVELLKEKHDDFKKNPKKVPDLDTLIFFKLTSVLYPTSDFRHPVTTPSLIFMTEILSQCKFKDAYSLSRGLFIVSLILEYTYLSKRYEPSAVNYLRGIFYLCANTSVLNPIQVVPPFKLHTDVKILNLECDCSKLKIEHKMAVKDLTANQIDNDFKIRMLATSVLMLKEFFDKYNDFEALKAIFDPHIQILGRVDLELYPKTVRKLVSGVLQHMKESLEVKTYTLMTREKVKPKALRLYEPDVQDVFTGSKNPKLSRENAERARLQAKYKREMKGALREVRRDKAYIANVKIKQKIHGDKIRKEKVKQIYKDASIQQGELNKLKRSK